MFRDNAEEASNTNDQPRNEHFESDKPFSDDPSLSLLGATGSIKYLNPTSAQYSWRGWNPDELSEGRRNSAHKLPSRERREDEPRTDGQQHERDGEQRGEQRQQKEHEQQQQHHSHQDVEEENRRRGEGEEDDKLDGHIPAKRKDALLSFLWRSRDNRKGRHTIVLRRKKDGAQQPSGTLDPTNTLPATVRGVIAIFTRLPYWDLSWWVAIDFALGSLIYLANGLIAIVPEVEDDSPSNIDYASAWTAFAGASIFLIGSVLLLLEAVNANRSGCFGWAVERRMKQGRPLANVHPGHCDHHHYHEVNQHDTNKDDEGEDTGATAAKETIYLSGSQDDNLAAEVDDLRHSHPHHWIWWPTWRDLRTHFFYEIGFLACMLQLLSATLFWLSKFTGLQEVSKHCSQGVIDGTHWAPQIVGCLGFIVVCILLMMETQQSWLVPAPSVLGWHVGLWKLIGSIGFALSAILGSLGEHGIGFATRQSAVASFWGSCALLIGSLVQWYESLAKHSVVEEGSNWYSEWNEEFIKEDEERRDQQDDVDGLEKEASKQRRYGSNNQ